ncbi:MAG: acyl-CoA thioesterase [Brevundimonas sp.]|uniref:acyl-CoA thioesterase n=1 Tax=Brevundimonas sp. TaxID=1871086 RepID=UPI00391A74D8
MSASPSPSEHTPPDEAPVGRMIAMPADTNPEGDIFGGWLLAQMDLAGSSPAFNLARGRCATVAVDSMVFHQPVAVGDEVSIYARVIRTGRTSIAAHVEAWKRGRGQDEMQRVTEGVFTYVAIDQHRRPRPLDEALANRDWSLQDPL